jgi:serine phosphatase RsbU (regulator of sigma subunit)
VEKAVEYFRSQPDIEVAEALNDTSFNIRFNDPELALAFAKRALVLSEEQKEIQPKARSRFNIGTAYHIIGTYDSAMYYYQVAEKLFFQINDAKALGKVCMQVGLLFSDSGDNERAIEYSYKALNYFYKARDTANIAGVFSNFAVFYTHPDSILHYQIKALELRKQQVNVEPEDKALSLSISYTNIGNTYQTRKQFNEAIYYYKMAIEADEKHEDLLYKISSYENLASCYQQMNEPRKAIQVARRAFAMLNGKKGYRTSPSLYQIIAYAYSDINQHDSAFYFLDRMAMIEDTMNNAETKRIIADMQQKYNTEKKESEIALLNKDKESAATFRKTLYLIIALILIVVIALVYSYVLKRRSNKDLLQKNEEINRQKDHIQEQKSQIEEKQKEIVDSINYAKRIQEAALPAKEMKYKLFPDAFVLFQPRDIVSGDFYWFGEKNGKRVIAAVDCTGHGVPGAFMSLIGNTFLNEIVNTKGITQPAEILNELRAQVIHSLKQSGGENKDGMDISILTFDDKKNTVDYAGANNPLWLIRNGECIEYKANKQPVGFYVGEPSPFTNHSIQFEKGDSFYIFTDGFADQFGGEKGKKFKYQNLKNFLVDINSQQMPEQERLLLERFNEWKGRHDQVDDVCIIGIRV